MGSPGSFSAVFTHPEAFRQQHTQRQAAHTALGGGEVHLYRAAEFEQALGTLCYPYWEETDNPAYQLFLA